MIVKLFWVFVRRNKVLVLSLKYEKDAVCKNV